MATKSPAGNARFDLFYRNGWAYLTVPKPQEGGSPVYPEEVENRLRLLGAPRAGAKRIREIIEAAEGLPAPLVEWPAGQALAGAVSVEIAEDRMSASITVKPPKKGAAPPTADEALEELARAGVVFGIDRRRIERLLEGREYGTAARVAEGVAPETGRGSRIRWHFNINRGKPYLEMDFGRINLRELNFIENRRAGDLLAELEAPTPAVDGRRVTGEPIPAERDSEDEKLAAGANTRLSEDRRELFAACDGNVRLADGRVLVEPVVTVKSVDYGTGNIGFEGSVVIEGGIADGFVVEAGGDIQVGSGVGKATLKAGGNILLKTGINGNGEGGIECGGDLYAKYLESCTVLCRGNVFVEEAVMHSQLTAVGHCVLNGRRSEVLASDLIVGGSFWCKKLGNFNEAPTRIAVGAEPRALTEYRAAREGLEARQAEWDKAERQLELLGKLIHDGRADERAHRAWTQVQAALDALGLEIAAIRGRLPALRELIVPSRESFALVEDTIFKGVVVSFGTLEYRASEAGLRKAILKAGTDQVIESGFNHHERPELDFGPKPVKP